jgi:hypothetical protein
MRMAQVTALQVCACRPRRTERVLSWLTEELVQAPK